MAIRNKRGLTKNTMRESLPVETPVLNTQDAEPGRILNGYVYDPARGWTEYEVSTKYGIEVWRTDDFIRFDDIPAE